MCLVQRDVRLNYHQEGGRGGEAGEGQDLWLVKRIFSLTRMRQVKTLPAMHRDPLLCLLDILDMVDMPLLTNTDAAGQDTACHAPRSALAAACF